jgi:hypothetical protein
MLRLGLPEDPRLGPAIARDTSIGPSCAVADVSEKQCTAPAGSQNSHVLRSDIAALLSMPVANVRVLRMEAWVLRTRLSGRRRGRCHAPLLRRRPTGAVQLSLADWHG